MRRTIALLTACVVVGATLVGPASAQVIDVQPRSIDFGKMKQRQVESSKVTVTNRGGGLLHITEVKADCGCTVPTLVKDTLEPGESTEIEIQFDSKVFEGRVHKGVQIYSNDPSNSVAEVMITAEINAPLLVDPPSRRVGFSRSRRGDSETKRAVFTATEADRLELEAPSSQGGFLLKVVENLDGDPRKAALEVTLPEDMAPGKHREYVRVTTNIEDSPYVDIDCGAWVTDLLTFSPESVNFRFNKTFKQTIRVAPFRRDLEFKVTGAEIDMPEIQVEVLEMTPNEETQVRLTGEALPADDPRVVKAKGRMSGTLKIHTDLPDMPLIEVPVTYLIRM